MASLRKDEKIKYFATERREIWGDPEMIFKVYTQAFSGNVMECSCSSLRTTLKKIG